MRNSDDLRIVICALQGETTLILKLAGTAARGDLAPCPALVLLHLTGSAWLPDALPISAITPFVIASPIGTGPPTRRGPRQLAYAMRAPPRA